MSFTKRFSAVCETKEIAWDNQSFIRSNACWRKPTKEYSHISSRESSRDYFCIIFHNEGWIRSSNWPRPFGTLVIVLWSYSILQFWDFVEHHFVSGDNSSQLLGFHLHEIAFHSVARKTFWSNAFDGSLYLNQFVFQSFEKGDPMANVAHDHAKRSLLNHRYSLLFFTFWIVTVKSQRTEQFCTGIWLVSKNPKAGLAAGGCCLCWRVYGFDDQCLWL